MRLPSSAPQVVAGVDGSTENSLKTTSAAVSKIPKNAVRYLKQHMAQVLVNMIQDLHLHLHLGFSPPSPPRP